MTTTERPRICRVSVRRADGKRRTRLVKMPYYERSPHDSLFGLEARLAELTLDAVIVASSVSVPLMITDKQRDKLTRWPQALADMGVNE
jgi:hypothetical protein